ncbi:TadE family type IV pilus minor pilin [Kitasatospora sp. NPDC101801]|uniref:TadE family type IV pilus minor pilin n=1 Tax=Kitasatospora sp. NPDC101801 TaxID=3364103 RepID=UPI003824A377
MRSDRASGPVRGRERGFVTAETAVALPALVLLCTLLVWGVVTAAAQIRCVDAARVGARAAARGDGNAAALARAAAPAGARVSVATGGDTVRVTVEAPSPAPGRLGGALSVRLHAEAAAAREDVIGSTGGGGRWPA